MSDTNKSTYELVEEKTLIENAIQSLATLSDIEDTIDMQEEFEKLLDNVTKELTAKTERIDYVLLKMNVQDQQLDGYINALRQEIDMAVKRKTTIDNSKKRIYTHILPLLVDAKGKLETTHHKYTIYETNGALDIIDPTQIPLKYQKQEIVVKINKQALKKDIIANGNTKYATVPKVKRVRKT